MKKMTNVQAIREFFEKDGGRPVKMDEFKALSSDERGELGRLSAEALGDVEIAAAK